MAHLVANVHVKGGTACRKLYCLGFHEEQAKIINYRNNWRDFLCLQFVSLYIYIESTVLLYNPKGKRCWKRKQNRMVNWWKIANVGKSLPLSSSAATYIHSFSQLYCTYFLHRRNITCYLYICMYFMFGFVPWTFESVIFISLSSYSLSNKKCFGIGKFKFWGHR